MIHEFYLVNRAEHEFRDYRSLINQPNAISLHNDLIVYMLDTLNVIPTIDPDTGEPHQGLNQVGPTVITKEGALIARRVFECYIELFAKGPAELEMTGRWADSAEEVNAAYYDRLQLTRDPVVTALKQLVKGCERIAASDGSHYLLHLGI